MSLPDKTASLPLTKQVFQPMNKPMYEVCLSSFYNCRNQALVQIKVSDDASLDHLPSTVVLVIDISGSMATLAATADDTDGDSGLSQLDVVKHAARAIIESLHEEDQLAIVSFSTNVKVEFQLAHMTAENREKAWSAVNSLQTFNQTNLYGGLMEALRLLGDQAVIPSNSNIMLLTDGMPNISPPRGELASLRMFLDANPRLDQVRISTFGFGYSLKSQLLAEIAQIGRSQFSFIPDASFVGTVFVNAVANILAVANPSPAVLKLEATPGTEITDCLTGQFVQETNWGLQIELPFIMYGQCIEILVETKGDATKEPFRAFVEGMGLKHGLESSAKYVDEMDPEHAFFSRAEIRSLLIALIRKAGRCETVGSLDQAKCWLNEAKQRGMELITTDSQESKVAQDIADIQKDLDGQVSEAYSRLDWHKRWGIHYILSLAAAHSLQQCTNFKDPGVQIYATQKFSMLRDACESKFIDLPPPQPSRVARKAVSSMRGFYNPSGVCFCSGFVLMADNTRRDISTIKSGDVLETAQGPVRVRCVVETLIPTGMMQLVTLPGEITVTPWHPMRETTTGRQNRWKFPRQFNSIQMLPCRRVFSLVLEEGGSSFRIGDYDAVSLGHGIQGGDVASHSFFGTKRVINELARMPGWDQGQVVLLPESIVRDPKSGMVTGFAGSSSPLFNCCVCS